MSSNINSLAFDANVRLAIDCYQSAPADLDDSLTDMYVSVYDWWFYIFLSFLSVAWILLFDKAHKLNRAVENINIHYL